MFQLPPERQPVIIAARRSAIGRAGGMFRDLEVQDLAAPVLRAALADTPITPDQIDDVILGNAAGPGGNIARLSALTAWGQVTVPGVTTDRQCGAGLEAVIHACRLVQAGAGEVFVAGGVESHSRKPHRALPSETGSIPYDRARFSPDSIGDPEMIEAADSVARTYAITRARQDAYALQSHNRAFTARDAGVFEAEIAAVKGQATDECPRRDLTLERLARLRPTASGGTVTVANACPLNDGAAAVVVTSAARARVLGYTCALAFEDAAAAGVDPNLLGIGPVAATRKLLAKRPDLALKHLTHLEFNEAFAAQVLASLDELNLPATLPNPEGGALALGHPFGASGAILITRLFSQLIRTQAPDHALAMAMIGIGGGQGLTAAFRPISL
ncbi:acetyl-CoA C-acetyltransferase [Shimia gijangensis]|uniref:Acetyl-CoA C-acetyltransferase n=1 Tax=Shimia gijangensis TaxID=1470563 RepID=A0A1M6RA34_9RHOB|nr:thiolase family protein [Shimia gijangensis]SHK29321.1 acetyl-CoA C-acetyltransferase [Shimia gijangensis]